MVASRWPYWNRTGGADHMFAFPHDEGACVAPIELRRSILITHWGRTQPKPPNHTTISAGQGWHQRPWHLKMMGGAAQCYLPGKDVLLPIFKSRRFISSSPFLTGHTPRRPVLFSFLGAAPRLEPSPNLSRITPTRTLALPPSLTLSLTLPNSAPLHDWHRAPPPSPR